MFTLSKLLLTGILLQNSEKEIMSLLCFLIPPYTCKSQAIDEENSNEGGLCILEHFDRSDERRENESHAVSATVSEEDTYRKRRQVSCTLRFKTD